MVVLMNMETGEIERAPLSETNAAQVPAAARIAAWPPLQGRLAEVCSEEYRPVVVWPFSEPVDRFLARMAIADDRRQMHPRLA